MSMLSQNHVQHGPIDAENHLRTKQFNASGTQPSVKKKALADVKNTLHQKSAQQNKKPYSSLLKQSNYAGRQLFSGKNEFHAEEMMIKKEKNEIQPMKSEILTDKIMIQENARDFGKTCKCDEIPYEDIDNDILFKDLKLTNSQIEYFALNWENTPVFSVKDKRALCPIEEKIETIGLDFNHEDAYESLLATIPEVKVPQLEVPVPPLFLEDELFMNGNFDCSIGL